MPEREQEDPTQTPGGVERDEGKQSSYPRWAGVGWGGGGSRRARGAGRTKVLQWETGPELGHGEQRAHDAKTWVFWAPQLAVERGRGQNEAIIPERLKCWGGRGQGALGTSPDSCHGDVSARDWWSQPDAGLGLPPAPGTRSAPSL